MRKENSTVTIECDFCHEDLTDRAKNEIVQREILVQASTKNQLSFCGGDWLDFCSIACANNYLRAHDGFRWMYDDEIECEDQSPDQCRRCAKFHQKSVLKNGHRICELCCDFDLKEISPDFEPNYEGGSNSPTYEGEEPRFN